MADYHSVYKGPEGETTQWQDIQAKLGNYAPKAKPPKFTPFDVEEQEVVDDARSLRTSSTHLNPGPQCRVAR